MTLLAPLSLLLALGAQLPSGKAAAVAIGETAELKADQLTYEPTRQVLVARGHAVLRSGETVLRADELTYDQAEQLAVARGGVLFVSGMTAAVADELSVNLSSQEATVKGGLFMQKRNVTSERLMEARSAAELKALGETTVALTGQRLQRTGPDQYAVEGLSFTPCDCKPTEPIWRIEARHAEVKVGESAQLTLPVVYIYSLPVLVVPWLDLPLSDRRTGLLVPRPMSSGLNGFALEQPVFVTLGQSYDLTLTPGYFFGARGTTLKDESGNVRVDDSGAPLLFSPGLGIQGPRLLTEFRYAPSEGTHGRVNLGLVYDLRPVRDVLDPSPLLFDKSRLRGLRGDFSLQHVQELGGGWHARVDASAVSDGYYLRDITTDVLQREDQSLRSTGALFHRGEDSYAGLDVSLRQSIRYGYSVFDNDRSAAGEPIHGPDTLQRLPGLRYALPERPLFGPVFGGLTVESTRISPLLSLTGDEGRDGVFDPLRPDEGQGDRRFQPGEREARDRLDLRPRLTASFAAGPYARVTPYLAWREDVYRGEVTGALSQRGYPLAGAVAETELSRTFGPGDNLRHAIRPSVELRWVPRVFGEAPAVPYDEVDSAVPSDGLFQAVAQLSQRLWLRQGSAARELLRLDLGQGFDLRSNLLGDSYGRLGGALGFFSLDAVARYNVPQARLTQLAATFNFDDGRGDGAYVRYDQLVTGGSDRTRRGLDMLFGTPAPLGSDAQALVAGGRLSFNFGLGVRYEAILQPLRTQDPISQQQVGVSWSPTCDCWRMEASATFHPNATVPDFGFSLTLARFGSFGAGG